MAWERWFDALGNNLFDKGKAVFVRTAAGDIGQEMPNRDEPRRC
jgi:hypothetical protein